MVEKIKNKKRSHVMTRTTSSIFFYGTIKHTCIIEMWQQDNDKVNMSDFLTMSNGWFHLDHQLVLDLRESNWWAAMRNRQLVRSICSFVQAFNNLLCKRGHQLPASRTGDPPKLDAYDIGKSEAIQLCYAWIRRSLISYTKIITLS